MEKTHLYECKYRKKLAIKTFKCQGTTEEGDPCPAHTPAYISCSLEFCWSHWKQYCKKNGLYIRFPYCTYEVLSSAEDSNESEEKLKANKTSFKGSLAGKFMVKKSSVNKNGRLLRNPKKINKVHEHNFTYYDLTSFSSSSSSHSDCFESTDESFSSESEASNNSSDLSDPDIADIFGLPITQNPLKRIGDSIVISLSESDDESPATRRRLFKKQKIMIDLSQHSNDSDSDSDSNDSDPNEYPSTNLLNSTNKYDLTFHEYIKSF